ncbi:unnamed protein product, partial [Durusdinium trenchii]
MARPLPVLPGGHQLELRRVEVTQLPECAELEAASYPEDEAASPESMAQRQRVAGDFFWALMDSKSSSLLGFVNGTCINGTTLTEEAMETHQPGGRLLCIHSVVVKEAHRRKGLALAMLQEYLRAVAALQGGASTRPEACALIAKGRLLSLYM